MTAPLETFIDSDALKYIISQPRGRKVLWDMLAAAGLFQQPMVQGDEALTYFNCGRLNQGLILWADCLTVDPDLTAMMIKEQGNVTNSATRSDRQRDAKSEPEPLSGSAPSDGDSSDLFGIPISLGLNRLTGRPFSNPTRGESE